jgi:hypothetical protein
VFPCFRAASRASRLKARLASTYKRFKGGGVAASTARSTPGQTTKQITRARSTFAPLPDSFCLRCSPIVRAVGYSRPRRQVVARSDEPTGDATSGSADTACYPAPAASPRGIHAPTGRLTTPAGGLPVPEPDRHAAIRGAPALSPRVTRGSPCASIRARGARDAPVIIRLPACRREGHSERDAIA